VRGTAVSVELGEDLIHCQLRRRVEHPGAELLGELHRGEADGIVMSVDPLERICSGIGGDLRRPQWDGGRGRGTAREVRGRFGCVHARADITLRSLAPRGRHSLRRSARPAQRARTPVRSRWMAGSAASCWQPSRNRKSTHLHGLGELLFAALGLLARGEDQGAAEQQREGGSHRRTPPPSTGTDVADGTSMRMRRRSVF
jgi:hypothetical protein